MKAEILKFIDYLDGNWKLFLAIFLILCFFYILGGGLQ